MTTDGTTRHPETPAVGARPASMVDVARLAGVSHQTVSRVLNGHESIRPATRAKVEQAIRHLRYRPNRAAQRLVTRRSLSIGLISTDSPHYGPTSTMISFAEAARRAGYQVGVGTISGAEPSAIGQIVERFLAEGVDALVLIAQHARALDVVAASAPEVPVLAAASLRHAGIRTVAIDQYAGARRLVEHLIGLGHTRIAHVAGPSYSLDAAERLRGWRDALRHAGLVATEPLVGDWSADRGYALVPEVLASGATAVFSANDHTALGLLAGLADRGVAVPERLSVAGFDDVPESAFYRPALTTVRQDFPQLGARLMAEVTASLDGADGEPVRIDPELILRTSTAAPTA